MSNITTVTHEQLVREVYTLQDQYARMNKMYEDLFYNLDYDNFSSTLSVDMQNFKLTFSEVFPDGSTAESAITMNAQQIRTWVSVNYQTQLEAGFMEANLQSSITQTAESITSIVSATYQTQTDAGSQYADLRSSITQTANSIRSEVSAQYGTVKKLSVIEQTVDKIGMLVTDGTNESKLELTNSFINLVSNKINIDGLVTFTALSTDGGMGTTKIHGGNIQANTITANHISTDGLSADVIKSGYISADRLQVESISWDRLNIQYKWSPPKVSQWNPENVKDISWDIYQFMLSTGEDIGKFYDIFKRYGFIE